MKILKDEKLTGFELSSKIFEGKELIDSYDVFVGISDDYYPEKNIEFDSPFNGLLYINYPLKVVVEEEFNVKSLNELIKKIRDIYKEIYEGEKNTLTKITKNNKYLINRGTSNGKFGIWGHDIEDLYLSSILVHEGNLVSLVVES